MTEAQAAQIIDLLWSVAIFTGVTATVLVFWSIIAVTVVRDLTKRKS